MELNEVEDAVRAHEYPATSAEIIEEFGDERIELTDGSACLGDVLARMGAERYDGPRDVHDSVLCGLDHEAVGRRYYTDRDSPSPGAPGPTQVSF